MSNITKLLDEASRTNGTGNIKSAISNIIEALRELQQQPAQKGVERRIFTVDLGSLSPEEAKAKVEELRSEMKDRKIPVPAITNEYEDLDCTSGSTKATEISKPAKKNELVLNKNGEPRRKSGPKPKKKETAE